MNVIITGSSGQLGRALIKTKPSFISIFPSNRNSMNLEKKESIYKFIEKIKPQWIINCAAYTNVDKAESNKELANQINSEGPKEIAKVIKNIGGKLLQISTDFVFDGRNNIPYKTFNSKNPINYYGDTKAKGEDHVLNILQESAQVIIIRTSWLMGAEGSNFALKMIDLLKRKNEINVVCDQIGSPTSPMNLANACWKTILNAEVSKILQLKCPILHWTNDGVASWYDVAFKIGQISNKIGLLDKCALVKPILTKDYPTPAKRPQYSVLDTFSTQSILDIKNNHWTLDLERDLSEFQKHKSF